MNNFINNAENNSPIIKRIGLSRKRKSFGSSDYVKRNIVEDHSNRKMVKENVEISNEMKILKAKGNHELKILEEENNLKCGKHKKDKIMEIERLYSTWRNGCKNAFLYLLDTIKKIKSQNVDVEKLMTELGILNIMSIHFKNDSDLELCPYNSD